MLRKVNRMQTVRKKAIQSKVSWTKVFWKALHRLRKRTPEFYQSPQCCRQHMAWLVKRWLKIYEWKTTMPFYWKLLAVSKQMFHECRKCIASAQECKHLTNVTTEKYRKIVDHVSIECSKGIIWLSVWLQKRQVHWIFGIASRVHFSTHRHMSIQSVDPLSMRLSTSQIKIKTTHKLQRKIGLALWRHYTAACLCSNKCSGHNMHNFAHR